LYRGARKEAQKALQMKFQAVADRRLTELAADGELQSAAGAALARALQRDEEYSAAVKPLLEGARRGPAKLVERSPERLRGPLSRETALGLLSGSGIRDVGADPRFPMTMTMAKDTHVQVFVAPYQDAWSTSDGGGLSHQQQRVWADKNSGEFGFLYTIGKEGGFVSSGAGVEVLFMRQQPGSPPGMGSPGMVQVRTYTTYDYLWRDVSYLGTAHQHAGFGVFVWSVDIGGGAPKIDLDWERWSWQDSTSWFDNDPNPSFPDVDYGTALQYDDMAPYFPIQPRRMYGAWIWCFENGDAHGADAASAAFAQAKIEATAKFVVVGQH
jgi:hypothetical protein